jgi:hypothetical protein
MATVREPETTTPVEPSPWLDLAAELHRIADDLETLVGEPALQQVTLHIQPHNADGYQKKTAANRPATIAAVDAVAVALLGKPAETKRMSDGVFFHHGVGGTRGPVKVDIYTSVADPDAVDSEQEIARLRAENERLRAIAGRSLWCGGECTLPAGHPGEHAFREDVVAEDAKRLGLLYTRADDKGDDPTDGLALTDRAREVLAVAPVSPARVPMHIGVVDDEPADPVHMDYTSGVSACGLVATHRASLAWRDVTCKECA